MIRARVALIYGVVVVVLSVLALVAITTPVRKHALEDVEASVGRAARLCENQLRLGASDLRRIVETLAHEREFVSLFTQVQPAERRKSAFVAVEAYSVRIQEALGQKADLLAVLDGQGKVLARDLDYAALHGEDFRAMFPAVSLALQGKAVKDIWNFDGKMHRVGVGPIKGPDGAVLGAIVAAYVVTAKDAREDRADFGTEVAYFVDGRVHSSSFSIGDSASTTEDVEKVQALTKVLFETEKLAAPVLETQKTSDLLEIKLQNEVYRAKVGVIPENADNKRSGFVVLSSETNALKPVAAVSRGVLIFGLLLLLAGIALTTVLSRYFLGGLDEVELGVSEVINGNMDFSFEKHKEEFEGLGNALNVLLARLLGRPEPGADEEEGGSAGGAEILRIDAPSGNAEEAQRLASEPEQAYYQRLFQEFTNVRRQSGERSDGLDLQTFVQKVRANEAMLKAKLDCRMVRFVAQQKEGRASLRPVAIH